MPHRSHRFATARRRFGASVASLALAAGGLTGAAVLAQLAAAPPAAALDNHLAATPPMGFNDWNAFAATSASS